MVHLEGALLLTKLSVLPVAKRHHLLRVTRDMESRNAWRRQERTSSSSGPADMMGALFATGFWYSDAHYTGRTFSYSTTRGSGLQSLINWLSLYKLTALNGE